MTLCQSLARQILPFSLAVGFPSAWLLLQRAKGASGCMALLLLKCLRSLKPDWQGESHRWGKSSAHLFVLAEHNVC